MVFKMFNFFHACASFKKGLKHGCVEKYNFSIYPDIFLSNSIYFKGISFFTKLLYYINHLKFKGYRILYSHA